MTIGPPRNRRPPVSQTQPTATVRADRLVWRALTPGGASSGLELELERHLTSLADSRVKRLVVEGGGRVGLHVYVHSGILDDLIAGLRALRQG